MVVATAPQIPTVWGLTPVQLHDRFWASQGVQVVRQGEPSEIVEHAELFLLTDARSLVMFNIAQIADTFYWMHPTVMYLRLLDRRERGYRERAIAQEDSAFVRFERSYEAAEAQLGRVLLTRSAALARSWQGQQSARSARRELQRNVSRGGRYAVSIAGNVYDSSLERDLMGLVRHLVRVWKRPDTTIGRASRADGAAWIDRDGRLPRGVHCIGPVWVGAGRPVNEPTTIVGPAVLWDDQASVPSVEVLQWKRIEPTEQIRATIRPRRLPARRARFRRAFDITFSLAALAATIWIYPLIMLAIWLEDGAPFFFRHRRETVGGEEFGCIKFRSMRKDAEQIKQQLGAGNESDGPQFHMKDDPRLTRVGRFIRKTNLDELPQFINVLLGQMSVVGPRPSPRAENQCCPPWREARLSVPPGITGLWQVKRTRQPGMDFQEWVRYDLEYVEKGNWRMDLWIIAQTVRVILQGGKQS